jgi:hypothetical protein
MSRAIRRLVIGSLVCSVALVTAGGRSALAAPSTTTVTDLGTIGFTSVIVDNANHHVFVSGRTANVVDVLDFSGNLVTTIDDVYGAAGMAINKGMLYIAESTAGTIARIHLKTLVRARNLGSGLVQPYWLAITGGQLWVTVDMLNGWGQIESVNLTSGTGTTFTANYYGADIVSSTGAPNTLFLAEDGLSPGSIYRLNVASGTPVEVAGVNTNQENLEQIVVSADGKRLIPASGWPYEFQELSATTLLPDGVIYPGQAYPAAVAVSSKGGGRLATGLTFGAPDLEVDPLGTPAPIFSATTNAGSPNVFPHGLALNSAGTEVFAVGGSAVYGSDAEIYMYSVI